MIACVDQFVPAQVLFNFRADRMVEISKAFEYEDFDAFDRKRWPKVRCPSQHGLGEPGCLCISNSLNYKNSDASEGKRWLKVRSWGWLV